MFQIGGALVPYPLVLNVACIAAMLLAAVASAQESYTLTIKEHRFEPSELQVPAGKKIKLLVKNLDSTAEEFESSDLKREKVIAGKSEAIITIGPLKPGTYRFVGEFNEKTAKGSIIAK